MPEAARKCKGNLARRVPDIYSLKPQGDRPPGLADLPWGLENPCMFEDVLDTDAALQRLMGFLGIEGITGQERAIGKAVVHDLAASGVPRSRIRFDTANAHIPVPTETGNLIVTLPGTRPGPRRLFSAHLDTVPLGAGAVPLHKGRRIVAAGRTALGGDNRTGCACLATMVATLLKAKLPHPPLSVLFTVREESGLWGARFVRRADLGNPVLGCNVDGRSPREITVGAVGADRWQVEVFGKAAHAGVHPEQGISATVVAALALTDVYQAGWFGKVRQNGKEGTSNVGPVGDAQGRCAGQATNVVTDYVRVRGESRATTCGLSAPSPPPTSPRSRTPPAGFATIAASRRR